MQAVSLRAVPTCRTVTADHQRFGFNFSLDEGHSIADYDTAPLQAGWYLDYTYQNQATRQADMEYTPLIRARAWQSDTFTETLQVAVAATPGTLWLVGNEPDRAGQDGLTPAEYARFYGETYRLLKQFDPTSRVAGGGLVQATPLRLRYLTMVLDEYQQQFGETMPVDVWNVHGFILPENYVWGASIPPGLEQFASEGMQYLASDHDNMVIFAAQMRAFRQWMADHGYRDRPLLVSEYGILLAPRHGFTYTRVQQFLINSFNFFLSTTDDTLGDPADGNRLVQRWSWFSLNYPPWDENTGQGFNGNLYNPTNFQIEALGQDFANFVTPHFVPQLDLALSEVRFQPPTMLISATTHLTVTANVINGGSVDGTAVRLRLWHGDPASGGTLLAEGPPIPRLPPGCSQRVAMQLTWLPTDLAPGAYPLVVEVATTRNDAPELDIANNQAQQLFLLLERPFSSAVYLPQVVR